MSDPSAARPSRWMNRLTSLVLFAGVAGVVVAGAPAVLRANGVVVGDHGRPFVPSADSTSGAGKPRGHGSPATDDRPTLGSSDEGDPLDLLVAPGKEPHAGKTRTAVSVRELGEASAPVTGKVPANARVLVVREEGEWVLIVHQDKAGVTVVGWALRKQITVP